jgi:hypothetical protein
MSNPQPIKVERVQTGVRMEKRLVKVLKGVAEYCDLTLGDLLESVCLHALEGRHPFEESTLEQIAVLKRVYGLERTAASSHKLAD